jgi:hypothetical protein
MSNANSSANADDSQIRNLFVGTSELRAGTFSQHDSLNSSSAPHGQFDSGLGAAPEPHANFHDAPHAHAAEAATSYSYVTHTYDSTSLSVQTADSADASGASEFKSNWQINSPQSDSQNTSDGNVINAPAVDQINHSLALTGPPSFPGSDLGPATGDGVPLAPNFAAGAPLSGCCPGCWRWMLAEAQGQSLPTLPSGIVLLGESGATSASLMHVGTSALSGTVSSGSLQSVLGGSQSAGLNINVIWDASVANAPAAFKSVVQSVVQFYESEFSNPITLNINVGWGEVGGTPVQGDLGESESFLEGFSYSQIVSALTQNASSSAQVSAINSLASSGNGSYYLTVAEATALGLATGTTTLDGDVGFSSTLPFAYNTTNTGSVPGGEYDLYGVVAHELSEVMGRISLLNFSSAYSGMDLFRYAAKGVLSTNATQSAYFSDNGGASSLYSLNTNAGGDLGDLSSSNNAFNAFSASGVINAVTSNDLTIMNVLGYNLGSQTPLPKVSGVSESPSSGAATIGEVIHLTVSFSEAVTVAGTPTLSLNDNGVATYAGGSGSNALTFSYTVSANDSAVAALAATNFNLNGGTVHDASGNNALLSLNGLNQSGPEIGASDPMAVNIGLIYEAVLQRAPTLAEITASEALQSVEGTSVMSTAVVDSAEAFTKVYPILQMFDLAFGYFPTAATLVSMVQSDLTVSQLSEAVVASQVFANTYNGGILLDPDASVTAGIVQTLYSEALGHAPTQATLSQWLNSDLSTAQAFQEMVTSQSYLETALPSIEQYLTTAASGIIGGSGTQSSGAAGDFTASQIDGMYEAVLQRAPTNIEVTASLTLNSTTGDAATVAAIVNSAEAITNVYPVLQMFDLAFGYFPVASTLASMVQSALTLPNLSSAVVASQTFANVYNGGTLIDPNSPVTAGIVEALYTQALGHAPTQSTLAGWLNAGLTATEAFQDMVTSQSYFQTSQSAIEQYLTAAADGAVSIVGSASLGVDMASQHHMA